MLRKKALDVIVPLKDAMRVSEELLLERETGNSDEEDDKKVEVNEIGVKLYGKVNGVFRNVKEFPDENITKVCEKYFLWLERIVSDFLIYWVLVLGPK